MKIGKCGINVRAIKGKGWRLNSLVFFNFLENSIDFY